MQIVQMTISKSVEYVLLACKRLFYDSNLFILIYLSMSKIILF